MSFTPRLYKSRRQFTNALDKTPRYLKDNECSIYEALTFF